MNVKRFLFAFIALLLFSLGYETLVHGYLLTSTYQETPMLWRTVEQMQQYVPFNIILTLIVAFWLTFIFTRFYSHGGAKNGLLFGLYIGVLSGLHASGAYFYLPISATLAFYWFAVNFIECLIGGYLVGLIYKQ